MSKSMLYRDLLCKSKTKYDTIAKYGLTITDSTKDIDGQLSTT